MELLWVCLLIGINRVATQHINKHVSAIDFFQCFSSDFYKNVTAPTWKKHFEKDSLFLYFFSFFFLGKKLQPACSILHRNETWLLTKVCWNYTTCKNKNSECNLTETLQLLTRPGFLNEILLFCVFVFVFWDLVKYFFLTVISFFDFFGWQ